MTPNHKLYRVISRLHPLYLALLFAVTALFLASCQQDSQAPVSRNTQSKPLHRVETAPVQKQNITIKKILAGNLEAVTRIRIFNEESARIISLPFFEGDQVNQGDILVKLDDRLIRAEVAKARASYKQAQADLKRLKKLLSKNISTPEEIAQARTTVELAKADVDYQLIRLKRTQISATISGIVTERLNEPGDYISEQTHILTLIDPTRLRVKLALSERYIPLVKPGQTVPVQLDSHGTKSFPAKIKRVFPTINRETLKGTIELEINPVPEGAKAGQFIRATIDMNLAEQLVIPASAILLEPAGSFVYRIKENNHNTVVEKVYFEKGPQYGNKTVINSGISDGDTIVKRGFLGLRDGKTVEIANKTAKKR